MVKSNSTTVGGTFRATHIINSDDGVFGKVFLVEVAWRGRIVGVSSSCPGEAIVDDVTIARVLWHRDAFHVGPGIGVQVEPTAAQGEAYTRFLNALLLREKHWSGRLQSRSETELQRAIDDGCLDVEDTIHVEMDETVSLVNA